MTGEAEVMVGTVREAYEQFVRMFENRDNPEIDALLYLAGRAGIAVAWIDRQVVELHIDRTLTDAEWAELAPKLDGYDEHICNFGNDPVGEFVDAICAEAGVERT